MSDLLEAREALGDTLRKLRRGAGLSIRDLAQACSWMASKVAMIENGRQDPTHYDIVAWTRATLSTHAAPQLHEQLLLIEALFRDWRGQAGTTTQRRWLELEANARHLRVFEPHFVPGLLQTASYARLRLLAHARVHHATDNVDDAVAMRLRRQAILHRADVEFHFLLTEFGLRSGAYGDSRVMAEQIEKISAQVGDSRVRVGVLPLAAEWDANVDHGFWMFERSHVLVETVTAELRLNRPEEIDTYWRVFHLLETKAVYGDDARTLLGNVLNWLR